MKQFIHNIPALYMRGGTSKGVFFQEEDLPPAGQERDKLLLNIMGSPDATSMQLNGLGGGISSTSKVVLISKAKQTDLDINYLFGQVSLTEAQIDWSGSCGNLASAVGLYALHKGLVPTRADGSALVKVWQANQNYQIDLHLAAPDKKTSWVSIPGVPGQGLAIEVEFKEPGKANTILPEDKPCHHITLPDGKKLTVTLVRGANPSIFIRAKDIGLTGLELPEQIDYKNLQPFLVHICKEGAALMHVPYSAAVRVAWLAAPAPHQTKEGLELAKEDCDLISRIITEGRIHHAYTGSGAINLARAAKIPGTIPYQMMQEQHKTLDASAAIKIAHPKGIMPVNAKVIWNEEKQQWQALSSSFIRTAKILMAGEVYI